jgi:hypothetical protein
MMKNNVVLRRPKSNTAKRAAATVANHFKVRLGGGGGGGEGRERRVGGRGERDGGREGGERGRGRERRKGGREVSWRGWGGRVGMMVEGKGEIEGAPQSYLDPLQNSLTDLMNKINSSSPHFIRCIKPNQTKVPGRYDKQYVQGQLKYTGVMETTRIRRCGYSTRLTFEEFLKR